MEPTIIIMSHPQTLPSKEGKDLVIASSAFLFSCKPVRLQLYDFHVIAIASGCSNVAQGQLSWFSASQSECSSTINFRIPLCNNMLQARDWLHNTGVKSCTHTAKDMFQCHQTLLLVGIDLGLGIRLVIIQSIAGCLVNALQIWSEHSQLSVYYNIMSQVSTVEGSTKVHQHQWELKNMRLTPASVFFFSVEWIV